MRIHICPWTNKTCRECGAPPRIYIRGKKYHYTIALTPDARCATYLHHGYGKSKWFVRERLDA